MSKRAKRQAPFGIPEELKIWGKRWRIKLARRGELDASETAAMVGSRGLTYSNREIHVAEHASPRAEASTFLHEVLHACSRGRLSKAKEEAFVADVEAALLNVLEQLLL